MRTPARPRFALDGSAWILIVFVLALVIAVMVLNLAA